MNEVTDLDAVRALRKRLAKHKKVVFPAGSVVRFTSGGRFTYVALYVAGVWYLSGSGFFGTNVMTNEQFFETLERADITNVALVSAWTEVS